MVVADTGAVVALIDADDVHHHVLREAFEEAPGEWLLPWAVLPEVDYIVSTRLGTGSARALRSDLAVGLLAVEWDGLEDLDRACELNESCPGLRLGLVDAVVMSVAERVGARAIATLDLRDFGAVELAGEPELWPRDL